MFFERDINSTIKYVNIMTNKYFYHECFLPVLFGLINVTYSAGLFSFLLNKVNFCHISSPGLL
ncbi:hypothetical protein C5P20_23700 [Escherichia coli]|nr:hypothetical protein C5P20_23700 [Escherichia coli]